MVRPGVGFVYQWTNLLNGKRYIGSHNGSNPKYIGSGKAFRAAVAKYGIENFHRVVLYCGRDYRQVETSVLKSVDAANNPLYYNLKNTAVGFDAATPRRSLE